ncbi:MAG: ankyrin repeat domain-containing protein [Candidatus Anstonellales archaeon]
MINIGAIFHGNNYGNILTTKIDIDENEANKIMSINSKDDIIRIIPNIHKEGDNNGSVYLLTKSYLLNAHRAFDILIDEFGVDINSPVFKGIGINGCDLTIFNIERGDITKEMEEVLLKHIHKFKFIENRDVRGFTPIFIASNNGNIRLANVLIKLKPDLNILDIYGNTALMYALNRCDYNMVKLLLENGSDPNIFVVDMSGYKVSHLYKYIMFKIGNKVNINDIDIILLMLAYGAKLFSIEFMLDKLKSYDSCILMDIISMCIENEEWLARYVCSRKLYDKKFVKLLRTAMFSKSFSKENAINDIIINFRGTRRSSARYFVTLMGMILNSIIDDIQYNDTYSDINTIMMDLYYRYDIVKFFRYKMCL